ncbi:MAG: DUF255 domain-containing protein [Clostridiales bacterium]|nr:DUF255 domain-containing protein [Clostridiales bacterium]
MSNRLSMEHSPYLLQHADNPVDWRPWGPEVFEEAKRSDVDTVYMAACLSINGPGGWPLTARLRQEAENRPGAPRRELVRQAASLFARSFDPKWGGFGPLAGWERRP